MASIYRLQLKISDHTPLHFCMQICRLAMFHYQRVSYHRVIQWINHLQIMLVPAMLGWWLMLVDAGWFSLPSVLLRNWYPPIDESFLGAGNQPLDLRRCGKAHCYGWRKKNDSQTSLCWPFDVVQTDIWQSHSCFSKNMLFRGRTCFGKVVPLARMHWNSGVWICNPSSCEIMSLIILTMQFCMFGVFWFSEVDACVLSFWAPMLDCC